MNDAPSPHKKLHAVLWAIAGVAVVFISFGVGMLVGYRRGLFSSNFGEEYYHNFYGATSAGPAGVMLMGGSPIMNQHGTAGVVIDVGNSMISVEDVDGDEESIAVGTDTVIRKMNQTITIQKVSPGDGITVIGGPSPDGQIQAKFIRIFPANPPQ